MKDIKIIRKLIVVEVSIELSIQFLNVNINLKFFYYKWNGNVWYNVDN